MPWTLNVYSARALCFLGFFPQTSLGLGSRLALQRGRRSIGSLSGSHEEETVNGGSDGMNFDGRPRRRHFKGGGSEHFAGRGAWRGEAWTMHGCAVDGWVRGGRGQIDGQGSGGQAFSARCIRIVTFRPLRERPPRALRAPSARLPRALRAPPRTQCADAKGALRLFCGCVASILRVFEVCVYTACTCSIAFECPSYTP